MKYSDETKNNRVLGYDIIINNFEPFLRNYLIKNIFLPNYANDWALHIPKGVVEEILITAEVDNIEEMIIDDFFENSSLLSLKNIILYGENWKNCHSLLGSLSKDKYDSLMNELNGYRRKIAHSRFTFSDLDLDNTINIITNLIQGEDGYIIKRYLDNHEYRNVSDDLKLVDFEEYYCQNNLPPEEYNLDGGFVGREKELKEIKNRITSDLDRVITIIGAGGSGRPLLH